MTDTSVSGYNTGMLDVQVRHPGQPTFQHRLTRAEAKTLEAQLRQGLKISDPRPGGNVHQLPPVDRVPYVVPQPSPEPQQPKAWGRIVGTLGSVYVHVQHIESVSDAGEGQVHVRMLGGHIHVVTGTTADKFMHELTEGQ